MAARGWLGSKACERRERRTLRAHAVYAFLPRAVNRINLDSAVHLGRTQAGLPFLTRNLNARNDKPRRQQALAGFKDKAELRSNEFFGAQGRNRTGTPCGGGF